MQLYSFQGVACDTLLNVQYRSPQSQQKWEKVRLARLRSCGYFELSCDVIVVSSSRISRPCWQSKVADTQGGQAGEEEDTKRSCQEEDSLQPSVST